jgi:hypothetical protein
MVKASHQLYEGSTLVFAVPAYITAPANRAYLVSHPGLDTEDQRDLVGRQRDAGRAR